MQFVQEVWNPLSRFFLKNLWLVQPRRMLFLSIIAFTLVAFFFSYRYSSLDYRISFRPFKDAIKSAGEEMRARQDLQRQLKVLQNITQNSLAQNNYSLDTTKIQSHKISESAKQLQKCANDFQTMRRILQFYERGAHGRIQDLKDLAHS